MGRGLPSHARDTVVGPEAILARARLSPSDLTTPCPPTRIARAVRAECWYGTLAGARFQARVGVASLLGSAEAWKSPALVYLGAGRQELVALFERAPGAIVEECAARVAVIHANPNEIVLGATAAIELADVVGPLLCVLPTAFSELSAEIRAAAHAVGDRARRANDRAAVVAAANEAAMRIHGWQQLAMAPSTPPIALIASYDSRSVTGSWDESPALELLMILDFLAVAGTSFDPAALRSLPPALLAEPWRPPLA